MRNRPYRLEGPPRLLPRLLAPLLVVATVSLFASGVALIVVGHGGGPLLRLHAISFLVWGVLMIVHVVEYVGRALRVGTADWYPRSVVVAGTRGRRVAIIGALLAGVVVAFATYPAPASLAEPSRSAAKCCRCRTGGGQPAACQRSHH